MSDIPILRPVLSHVLHQLHQAAPTSTPQQLADAAMVEPTVVRAAGKLGIDGEAGQRTVASVALDAAASRAFSAADGLEPLAVPLAFQWCCLRWARRMVGDDPDAVNRYLEAIIQHTSEPLTRMALTAVWMLAATPSVRTSVIQ